MKPKNIRKLIVGCLLAFAVLVTAVSARAQSPVFKSFLGDNSYLILPWAAAGTNESLIISNQFYVKGWTQTNSANYPYVSGYGPIYAVGTALSDVPLWGNRDGTAALASMNVVVQDSATTVSTNALLFTLTTINSFSSAAQPPLPTYANAQPVNTWSFIVSNTAATTTPAGGDLITVSTNIPQGFLQGALGLRLSITSYAQGTNNGVGWTNYSGTYYATNSSYSQTNVNNGWQLIKAGISGFQPTGNE